MTKSPTHESARVGITAKAICPDYIATDMVMAMPQKTIDATIAQIPTRRLGEPEEIARCLVFLASEDVGFINGSTITPMMDSFSSKSYLRPATFGRTK